MTFTRPYAAGAGLLVGALLTAVLVGRGATIRIAQANAEAAAAAAMTAAAQQDAESAYRAAAATSDSLRVLRRQIADLRAQYQIAKRDIPAPTPLPSVCQPCVDRGAKQDAALAKADSTIAAQDAALVFASGRVEDLTRSLGAADSALGTARAALAKQSERTEGSRPAKLLGLVPLPTLHLGYGATLADKQIHHGPTASVGWTIRF